MPIPLPIGEPSGITAAQPTSTSRRASTGSSVVYGSTTKPSSTSSSAARSSSGASGSSVSSSPITSSLIQSVCERLARQAGGQHGVARRVAAGGVRQQLARRRLRARRSAIRASADRRDATRPSRAREPLAAIASASSSSEVKPPVPSSRRERSVRPAIASVARVSVSSSCSRRSAIRIILPASPSAPRRARLGERRTTPTRARGTTSPSTATATPRASPRSRSRREHSGHRLARRHARSSRR